MMDFMKKLNPFKRNHHRQTEQAQQDPSARQHQHQQTHHHQHNNSDSKRKAADKELQHLNQKIEKILANLDENETGVEFSREEECVVCLSSKATMKTYPCGHCVVCRVCFVKTIQAAVSERRLPLKCVVCRTKILKLKQQRTSPAPRRPNLRPSSWSRGGGGPAPSGNPARNRRTAGQDSAADAARSGAPLSNHRLPGAGGGATVPAASTASAAAAAAHRPTATKLMQPLLIYPANPARPGDPKRRPGPGWMSPTADAGTTTTAQETVTTAIRLRTRNAPGSVGGGGSAGGGIGSS